MKILVIRSVTTSVTNLIDEIFFRFVFSVFWILFLGIFGWAAHSTKWGAGRKMSGRTKRLRSFALAIAAIYFVGAFLYALESGWISFFFVLVPDWFRLMMVGVAAIGLSFVSWALRSLGRNWAPSLSGIRESASLVTAGPYGIVRHPIYFGAVIFLGSLAIISANLLTILPTVVLIILLYAQLPDEESMLLERFGDDYREYMKRTPRFLPRFKV